MGTPDDPLDYNLEQAQRLIVMKIKA